MRSAVVAEPVPALAVMRKTQPVSAWRLVAMREDGSTPARRVDTPMVGRSHELQLLSDAFERAAKERICALFTLLGPPGAGKTRLVEAFVAALGDRAAVVRGRCLPYGEGITYWPVVEILHEAASLAEARARPRSGQGSPGSCRPAATGT